MPDAPAPRPGGVRDRRHRHDHPAAPTAHRRAGLPQRRLRHPLAGRFRRREGLERSPRPMSRVTPEMLLRAYALGVFPMAEGRENREIYWIDPEERGILPLDGLHVPRRLLRTLRHDRF